MIDIVEENNEIVVPKLETRFKRVNFDNIQSIIHYGEDLLEERNKYASSASAMQENIKNNVEVVESDINIVEVAEKIDRLSHYFDTEEKKKDARGLLPKLGEKITSVTSSVTEKILGREVNDLNYSKEIHDINESIDALQMAVEKRIKDTDHFVEISKSVIKSDMDYAKELDNLINVGYQDLEEYKKRIEELENSDTKDDLTELEIADMKDNVIKFETKLASLKETYLVLKSNVLERLSRTSGNTKLSLKWQEFSSTAITNIRVKADSIVDTKIQSDNIRDFENVSKMYNQLIVSESKISVNNIEKINQISNEGILKKDTIEEVSKNLKTMADLYKKAKENINNMAEMKDPLLDNTIKEINEFGAMLEQDFEKEEQGFQKKK